MNKVELMGRLTKAPDTRYTNGENTTAISRFTLAVDRKIKKENELNADFISCVAFGKQGEFCEKYLDKGSKVVVIGRIQTGSYTNKDGNKVYTTDIVTEEIEFAESKRNTGDTNATQKPSDDFLSVPEGEDDDFPFGAFTR